MENEQKPKPEFSMLSRTRPQPVDLAEIKLTKTSYLTPGQTLPWVVEPAVEDVDLVDWAKGNLDELNSELLKHGAILFRGFHTSIPIFEEFAESMAVDLIRDYGDLPTEGDTDGVYHSTPYPNDQTIEFHSESSHLRSWPAKQFFMCTQPAQERGETPIIDCRRVYQQLDPDLRDKFQSKQLKYVRNFIPKLDVSWQTFFRTTEKAVVEQRCRETQTEVEWKDGDTLRTSNLAPGVIKHPKTGELSFFNQVQLHHVSALPDEYRESTLAMFSEENLPRNVYFGDGTPITDEEMDQVRDVYCELAIDVAWQKGDILMLDNMLVAHARRPFVGPRKIVVAMGDPVNADDV